MIQAPSRGEVYESLELILRIPLPNFLNPFTEASLEAIFTPKDEEPVVTKGSAILTRFIKLFLSLSAYSSFRSTAR